MADETFPHQNDQINCPECGHELDLSPPPNHQGAAHHLVRLALRSAMSDLMSAFRKQQELPDDDPESGVVSWDQVDADYGDITGVVKRLGSSRRQLKVIPSSEGSLVTVEEARRVKELVLKRR